MREFIAILNEINLIEPFDEDPRTVEVRSASYTNQFGASRIVGRLPSGYQVLYYRDGIYFIVTSRMELVGRAVLVNYRGFSKVSHVWFKKDFRGKNIGYEFYVFLLNEGKKIISDWDQTPSAAKLWSRLARDGYVHAFDKDAELIGDLVYDVRPYYGERNPSLLIAVSKGSISESAMRPRKISLYCNVVCDGALVLAKMPEHFVPWAKIRTQLYAALREHLGVKSKDVFSVEGLAGDPPGTATPWSAPEDEKTLEKLNAAFSGSNEYFAKFVLFSWDEPSQTFQLSRSAS